MGSQRGRHDWATNTFTRKEDFLAPQISPSRDHNIYIPPLKRQGGDRHRTAQRISGKEKARRRGRGGPSVIQCRWTSWLDPGFAADESSLHFSSRDGLLEKHICTEAHPECHPKIHAPPLCCWVSRLSILLSTSSNFAQFFEPRVSAAQTIPSAEGSPLRPSSRPFSAHPSRSHALPATKEKQLDLSWSGESRINNYQQ